VQIITGIELPCEVAIGRNFVIEHSGGIVISGYARFGDNCRIRTVWSLVCAESRALRTGDRQRCRHGAGAKLLGPIHVGNNVVIGANAVVISDVSGRSIAVGVPATIKPRRSDER